MAHGAAVEDVLRADVGPSHRLGAELRHLIETQHYAAVIVDRPSTFSYLPKAFPRYYELLGRIFPNGHRLLPATGTMTGPWSVWIPRPTPLPASISPKQLKAAENSVSTVS